MKFIEKFKNFLGDFIHFFWKEFFKDNHRNDFIDYQNSEKFLAKYLRSKISNKVKIKINNNPIINILTNEPRNSSFVKKSK